MRRTLFLLALSAALLAGCSSAQAPTSVDPASMDSRGGILPGYPLDADLPTPLVITSLAPDPIPVTGTDGKVHVAYELTVLNTAPRPATVMQVQTLADSIDGEVVTTVGRDEVVARTLMLPSGGTGSAEVIPAGGTAILVLDDVYAARADVPAQVTHRIAVELGPVLPGSERIGAWFPDSMTQFGGVVRTSGRSPVVIGAPLAGDGWVAANGCCEITSHRGTTFSIGGRINGTERFAIDWMRIDPSVTPLTPSLGDESKNESFLAYDAPLLAVADGTVVTVVEDMIDEEPGQTTTSARFSDMAGNRVIIDIGGGNYALYAHLIPGTSTVKVGDKVKKGQVIGNLGNSGNSSAAHLHFHIARAPTPLAGDNMPYEIERFDFAGSTSTDAFVAGPDAGERTNQLPLNLDVVNFPAGP